MKRTPNRGNNGSNKKVIGSPYGQLGNLIKHLQLFKFIHERLLIVLCYIERINIDDYYLIRFKPIFLLTESFLQCFLFICICIYIVTTENLSCQRPQGQLVLADGDVIEVH